MNILRLNIMLLMALAVSGCTSLTSLYFYPQTVWISTPTDFDLRYEDVMLTAHDGTGIHGWWVPAQGKVPNTGVMVLYLHGNSENISSQARSVYWLAQNGVSLMAMDYRGFGASEGEAIMPSVMQDIEAAAAWMRERYPERKLVVLGQSMGASLAINFVAAAQDKYQIDALFAEAPFRGFPAVARSALSSNILGWLVWPFTVLVPSRWDPQNVVQDIHVPVMIMSSPDDQIVPHKQSRQLYEMLTERSGNIPSCWVESHGPHIASFNDKRLRRKALKFIRSRRCPALSGT
ncbi:MAG: hypothetical protein CMI08_09675 [Oceanospirillaceae bacterium]|uniref:alpha/beta hydrolase n=1 Tax=unclassified Thalassolituus TaxID=2624967 RepID=UPI000C0A3092|nr:MULTISPECIES: alpha/beta fold hydrolase [unclassified Thalassolituus]MAK91989.1 hypothetical protein [Thalassolituus sp.]MAS24170.1 hypothetical protein [Oceanospirillaceae bacterium]MAX99455.1 hypothetical protein [Oceanospirillaceae bacterium]MBS53110.1 hypothetical protein [Oceanospirillaceae bacterium]|tara:strand:- start:1028 stop:1897 length:870 start_codon:yes stop_codon:yes gene_type:complete